MEFWLEWQINVAELNSGSFSLLNKDVNIIDPNPIKSYKRKKNFPSFYTEINPEC